MKVSVHVITRSSRNSITENPDGSIRAHITKPPVDGEANSKLIELLSEYYSIPRSSIIIISGQGSKHKIVEIPD